VKRLLNTLYVTTRSAQLTRVGGNVVVRDGKQVTMRVPVHTLESIVCFGTMTCTAPLLSLCSEHNVQISFLTENGRFLARIQGPVSGNVLLRREQYRRADEHTATAEIARAIVIAKIANCRNVLLRAVRNHREHIPTGEVSAVAEDLRVLLVSMLKKQGLDSVRGKEGEAARKYFSVFDHLIIAQKDAFFFTQRSRRPPLDSINTLLSFLYTLLRHDISSALETMGLDPAVGYLHRDRPGRPGLALDLMEEFRPVLADRLALSLVNRRQVHGEGFRHTETGAVMMDEQTRKKVITAYQTRKREEIRHPFLGERVQLGLLPYAQALLMSRFLRGDLDGYHPFVWR